MRRKRKNPSRDDFLHHAKLRMLQREILKETGKHLSIDEVEDMLDMAMRKAIQERTRKKMRLVKNPKRRRKSPRRRRRNPSYRWLKKEQIKRWVPEAKKRGISKVARSPRGFLAAYKKAGYNPKKLPKKWRDKRNAFIKRHLAQAKKNREDFWKDGKPSRRLVALRIWAYGGK